MPFRLDWRALGHLVRRRGLLTSHAAVTPYESDALTAYRARPAAVVLPETQDEVIEIVRICHRHGVPFVARGSGTSLSGGSLPIAGRRPDRAQPAEPHPARSTRRSGSPWSSRA